MTDTKLRALVDEVLGYAESPRQYVDGVMAVLPDWKFTRVTEVSKGNWNVRIEGPSGPINATGGNKEQAVVRAVDAALLSLGVDLDAPSTTSSDIYP